MGESPSSKHSLVEEIAQLDETVREGSQTGSATLTPPEAERRYLRCHGQQFNVPAPDQELARSWETVSRFALRCGKLEVGDCCTIAAGVRARKWANSG